MRRSIFLIAIIGILFLFFIFFLLKPYGCSKNPPKLTYEEITKIPESFYIENVPFFDYTIVSKNITHCAATVLAMVMRFYDNTTTPDEIGQAVSWKESSDKFMEYARNKGLKTEVYESSIEDLKLKISEGKPVIVLQGFDLLHRGGEYSHSRVVVGYTKDYFITYDPDPANGKNYKINTWLFQVLWNQEPGSCNIVETVYK